jgi:hypothetical protein
MPTDLQMLIVLNPCLFSLSDGMPQIAADIEHMEAEGKRAAPRAPRASCMSRRCRGTSRTQEPLARPLRPATARLPINEGSRTHPKNKPASGVVVNDTGNLAYVARAMELDGFAPHEYLAYLACDDFKAFFNQFSLHPSEWSRFCLAFLRGGDLFVASQRVLCFGCAPSSGIVQRFAHLVRQIVTERMIAAGAPFVADLCSLVGKHLSAWFALPNALSAETSWLQALFFHISIYTDDSGQGAVGCARMQRFDEIWTEVCKELGIQSAMPHKRGLGTFALPGHHPLPHPFSTCCKVLCLVCTSATHWAYHVLHHTGCTQTSERAARTPTRSSALARPPQRCAGAGLRSSRRRSAGLSPPSTAQAAPPSSTDAGQHLHGLLRREPVQLLPLLLLQGPPFPAVGHAADGRPRVRRASAASSRSGAWSGASRYRSSRTAQR